MGAEPAAHLDMKGIAAMAGLRGISSFHAPNMACEIHNHEGELYFLYMLLHAVAVGPRRLAQGGL